MNLYIKKSEMKPTQSVIGTQKMSSLAKSQIHPPLVKNYEWKVESLTPKCACFWARNKYYFSSLNSFVWWTKTHGWTCKEWTKCGCSSKAWLASVLAQTSLINPFNASCILLTLDLVIGPHWMCKGSFDTHLCPWIS